MPIKLPKGFTRRKSSGNALEEVETPPQSSFRVFERPSVDKKSMSDGNLLSKRLSSGQPLDSPTEEQDNNIFATPLNHPQRQLGVYDHSSPKRRSTDGPLQSDNSSPHSRNLYDIPIPPISGALRAAGRTFSFGGRFSKSSAPPPQQSTPGPSRNRAMTNSTSSTATPPKLPDTELQIGHIGDEFHNMFDDMGKRGNVAQESSRNGSVDTVGHLDTNRRTLLGSTNDARYQYSSTPPETGFRKDEKVQRPAPINTDRSKEVEPSPYSWGSRHSEEGLLAAVDSPHEEPPATYSGFIPYRDGRRKSLPLSNAAPITTTTHRSLEKPEGAAEKGLRRSVLYPSKRDSTPVEDEDAKLIMSSLYTSRRSSQLPFASDHEDEDAENETPLFTNKTSQPDRLTPPPLQPPAHKSPGLNDDHLDPSIAAHARLAVQYENTQPPPMPSTNKVMTPSQFEHYRQQQELRRSKSDASKSEDSEESDFDEEDENEKNREAEKQRRKQEAHLSVYRQQMMKVTGQQSPAPSLRPEMDRASNSAPNLTAPFTQGNRSGSGKSSEGDEDEEVPLGILAAHGFPNRNRPPSRLAMSSSIPNLRASFHQPYISSPGSVAENDSGNRSSLPVFARNLPRDPYYGAGLVNSSNRESLAFGGGAGSVYGGPPAPAGPPPGLPPGGLIGVIATEERARAMRRRSPNTQAMHDFNAAMPSVTTHPNGIPRPYTMMSLNPPNVSAPQQVTATEQAQIQLSQQMSSMMQMQMQWMQQMIHMQGGQGPPPQQGMPMPMPMPMPPGGLPTVAASPTIRPSSMPSAGPNNLIPPAFGGDQRTFSLLDPNASSRLNASAMPYASGANRPSTPAGQGYAPSIAPSERSNVGLAPRYRPVSTLQPDTTSAAYPLASKPWNDENQRSSVSIASPAAPQMPKPTPRPISNGGKSALARGPGNGIAQDDEDDDEGWAEMMKKRENKRSNWKSKKETSSLGDLLNTVH